MRLRIGSREFAPPAWALLLTALGIAAFVSLGSWQLGRAAEKRALREAFAQGQAEAVDVSGRDITQLGRYQRVRLHGTYEGERQVLLDNMPSTTGRPGYRVLTPLARADGQGLVLVDRGWVPLGATREQLPGLEVGTGERDVNGVLDEIPRPGLRVGAAAAPGETRWPRVLLFPTDTDLEAALGHEIGQRIVLLDADAADGYERQWQPSRGFGPERHLGYAIQWFALGLAAIVLFVALNLRRPPRTQEADSR
jgi:cytochrome oxidase assembly protein ShyY1